MKDTLKIIVLVIVIGALAYGGWQLQRTLNYKFSYSSQVDTQIKPLVDRISALELKVKNLENKK